MSKTFKPNAKALAVMLIAGAGALPLSARPYDLTLTDSWEPLGTFGFLDGLYTGTRHDATLELNRDNTDFLRVVDPWTAANCTEPLILDVSHPYSVVIPEQAGGRSSYYNSGTHYCSMSYYRVYLGGETFEDFIAELPHWNCTVTATGVEIPEWAIVMRFVDTATPDEWGYANDPMTVPLPEAYYALDFEADGVRYHIHSLNANTVLVNGAAADAATVTVPAAVEHDGAIYTVVGINHRAFYQNTVLEGLTLPEGIASVGDNAFTGCTNLAAINLSTDVALGQDTFKDCPKLTDAVADGIIYRGSPTDATPRCEVVGADNDAVGATAEIRSKVTICGREYTVTGIASGALADAATIATLKIPATVTAIAYDAFGNNTSLSRIEVADDNTTFASTGDGWLTDKSGTTLYRIPDATGESVTLPSTVTALGAGCLYRNSGVKTVIIPETVTEIAPWALVETALTSLTVPGSVVSIAENAVNANAALETLTIGEGVKAISRNNLNNNTSLRTLNIPASLCDWKIQLSRNDALEAINVAEGNAVVCDIDGVLFSADRRHLIRFPASKATEYVIPEGTERLVSMDYSLLTKVTIPASVTQIDNYCFAYPMALTSAGRTFTHMTEINVLSPVPVPIEYEVFVTRENNRTFLTYTKATLKVPKGSLTAYSDYSNNWSNFDNKAEVEYGALDGAIGASAPKVRCNGGTISIEGDCRTMRVHSLDGCQVYAGPAAEVPVIAGALYVVTADGHSMKILAR